MKYYVSAHECFVRGFCFNRSCILVCCLVFTRALVFIHTNTARKWNRSLSCTRQSISKRERERVEAKKLSQKWKNFNAVKRNHRIFLVIHCNKSCALDFFTAYIRYPVCVCVYGIRFVKSVQKKYTNLGIILTTFW